MRKHVQRFAAQRLQRRYATSTAAASAKHASAGSVNLPSKLDEEVRRNAAGVQLLSPFLQKQVFGVQALPPLHSEAIAIARQHLARHGLAQKDSPVLPKTEFTLPRLQGEDIEEHFYNIGLAHAQPYLDLAKQLAQADLPSKPDAWAQEPGWVCYEADGSYTPIDHPPCEAIVFDVETLYKISDYAVMAVAASSSHWYSWCSAWLLDTSGTAPLEQLVPLPGRDPRLIVGHNVGYDRARIDNEYNLNRSQNRFLDTMSLHVAVKGLTTHQRVPWMQHRKAQKAKQERRQSEESEADSEHAPSGDDGPVAQTWQEVSSMNSLADVAKLHCNLDVDKTARNRFITEDKQEIVSDFQDLMSYCAEDVAITHQVFKVVLPAFLQSCPNPVTFAGVLHMGSSFLPVDESWPAFIESAESKYEAMNAQVVADLRKLADEASYLMFKEGADGKPAYASDPWLKQLDWSPKRARFDRVKLAAKVDASAAQDRSAVLDDSELNAAVPAVEDAESPVAKSENGKIEKSQEALGEEPDAKDGSDESPHIVDHDQAVSALPQAEDRGEPAWFSKLCKRGERRLSAAGWAETVPLLVKASWEGQIMHRDTGRGWCYEKKPASSPSKFSNKGYSFSKGGQEYETITAQTKRAIFTSSFVSAHRKGQLSFASDLGEKALKLGVSRAPAPTGHADHATLERDVLELAEDIARLPSSAWKADRWLSQLDWDVVPGTVTKAAPLRNQDDESVGCNDNDDAASLSHPHLGVPSVFAASHETSHGATQTRSPASTPPDFIIASTGEEGLKTTGPAKAAARRADPEIDRNNLVWPKWYWDLHRPGAALTIRSKLAPLLLKLRWNGAPMFHSRQHGWLYRTTVSSYEEAKRARIATLQADTLPDEEDDMLTKAKKTKKGKGKAKEEESDEFAPLSFTLLADEAFALDTQHVYFKLPHKDGAKANVGNPLSKSFIPAFEQGVLSSEFGAASSALEMNAQCSYWTSARERVRQQFVVWNSGIKTRGFPQRDDSSKFGMILPQVITMGTVTRRAVESTWLAASNAKKNRLGSELKAMIKAPPGYAIVGADVDSEELWICCVMGDAQFGIHGATAIGWMTLEGTKSAGTDLHSKTASILGISRDMAKVFNYSRIYGAGVKHAVQLLMQSNAALTKAQATESAKLLYASTKGLKEHNAGNIFSRKFWYGGTESHVFNTLEAVAMADDPRTPALGCAITAALAKNYLPQTEKANKGEDFMPSRINWVVQSSGVDYLHMLMVSMEYLTQRFGIDARFMLSVHDEIRYLVKEEDRHRAALALQISNLWTRSYFSHRLQMESLPQSCAWFSAVDIDHVLRKEVNMDCVTPSQPIPIPHGVSQDIEKTLQETAHGTLFADGRPMTGEAGLPDLPRLASPSNATPTSIRYRSSDLAFLRAQNADSKKALAPILNGQLPSMLAQTWGQPSGFTGGRHETTFTGWDDFPLAEDPPFGSAANRTAAAPENPPKPIGKGHAKSNSRSSAGTSARSSNSKTAFKAASSAGDYISRSRIRPSPVTHLAQRRAPGH